MKQAESARVNASPRGVLHDPRLWLVVPGLLASLAIFCAHHGAFTGTELIPFDEITDYYPWYVNALHSAREGIFETLNPYKLGGMPNMHLFAQYDVFYWLPLLTRSTPGLYGHQLIGLCHLFMIPPALIWIAWLHQVRGPSLLGIAGMGVVAAFIGPVLNYQQHINALESYCWGFVALACFETWLERGRSSSAIASALALAYAFNRFSTLAVFWPLFLLPYAAVSRDRILRNPAWVRQLVLAGALALALVTPFLVQGWHLWHLIAASVDLQVNNTLTPVTVFDALGFPMAASLIALPSLLLLLSARAISKMPLSHRLSHGAFIAIAFVYSFGQLTPFCDLLRTLYPPAAFFRRPYAILYVLFAVLFSMIAQQWSRIFEEFPARWSRLLTAGLVIGGLAFIRFDQTHWKATVLVTGLAVAAIWNARRWHVVAGALILQWGILCYRPFLKSEWHDVPVSARGPLDDFSQLSPFLPGHTPDSRKLFRVVSVGLPATFGAYSSVIEYYNAAPDYSTIFPRELIRKTGIDRPHAAEIGSSFLKHPELVGSRGMEELSVRYYIFAPDLLESLRPKLHLGRGTLREVPAQSYWKVVEDTAYHPFVASEDERGHVSEAPAVVHTDRLILSVPADSVFINLGFIYDTWWHLTVDGAVDDAAVVDNGGQLQVRSGPLRGKSVSLEYGSALFSFAVVIELCCYALLISAAAWSASRRFKGFLSPAL
jgi:hypothetical protein